MSNPAILWTAEQTEELKRLYAEGHSCSAIGGLIGKSRCAVIGRIHRIGLKRRGAGNHAKIEVGKRRGSKPQPREKTNTPPRVRSLRPSQEQIELRVAAVDPLHIGLLDLESHHCRYPYGETPITFCGHQVFAGFSYCAPHFFLCTGIGTPSERAATDISKRVREAV